MPSERSRRPARCLPHLSSAFAVWWRRRAPRRGVSNRGVGKRRSSTADRYSGVRDLSSVPELRGPIDARLFFERFVATRTPVIVRGGVQRETMAVLADDAALDAAAGDCQLQVEVLTYRGSTHSLWLHSLWLQSLCSLWLYALWPYCRSRP